MVITVPPSISSDLTGDPKEFVSYLWIVLLIRALCLGYQDHEYYFFVACAPAKRQCFHAPLIIGAGISCHMNKLDQVKEDKYLKSCVTTNGDCLTEMKRRIVVAETFSGSIDNCWNAMKIGSKGNAS